MDKIETLQARVCTQVDAWRGPLIEIADWIFAHPEPNPPEHGAVDLLADPQVMSQVRQTFAERNRGPCGPE